MQVKDFHDQALKESEREEYWIRLLQYVAVWCCGAEIMYVSSILTVFFFFFFFKTIKVTNKLFW